MRNWTGLGLAVALCGCAGDDRFPTSRDFPPSVMGHSSFQAPAPLNWKIATLSSPRDAPWRVVVVTGTPSWSEYWAPLIAELPPQYSIVVADRPGFAASEPREVVGSIQDQATALGPMIGSPQGPRNIILVGQSYGAAISILMASHYSNRVAGLVLVSPFMGQMGPTASTLVGAGQVVRPLLPRDLKNAHSEVRGQSPQLPQALSTLQSLPMPVTVVYGDKDTFVPLAVARKLADPRPGGVTQFVSVPGGDHFLNACCVKDLIAALDRTAILAARPQASAMGSSD